MNIDRTPGPLFGARLGLEQDPPVCTRTFSWGSLVDDHAAGLGYTDVLLV